MVNVAIPCVSNLGSVVRYAKAVKYADKIDDVADAAKLVNKADDAKDAVRSISQTEELKFKLNIQLFAGKAKMTVKEATDKARKIGFKETNYLSHGQPVFKKGRRYITSYIDMHNGGVWKMADSVKNLGSKKSRMGTYDQFLNRIGG